MKRDDRRAKPKDQVKIAKERIEILIGYALKEKDEKLSKRYFEMARRIGMRYNVKMPAGAKRKFCKHCSSKLTEGWRSKKGIMHTTCRSCGKSIRYPFKPIQQRK